MVGTLPFGFIARYSGSRLPPNGPPRSTRSYSMPSSAQHHSTFCTLDEVVRPQIFSIEAPPSDLRLWSLRILLSATPLARRRVGSLHGIGIHSLDDREGAAG